MQHASATRDRQDAHEHARWAAYRARPAMAVVHLVVPLLAGAVTVGLCVGLFLDALDSVLVRILLPMPGIAVSLWLSHRLRTRFIAPYLAGNAAEPDE